MGSSGSPSRGAFSWVRTASAPGRAMASLSSMPVTLPCGTVAGTGRAYTQAGGVCSAA